MAENKLQSLTEIFNEKILDLKILTLNSNKIYFTKMKILEYFIESIKKEKNLFFQNLALGIGQFSITKSISLSPRPLKFIKIVLSFGNVRASFIANPTA